MALSIEKQIKIINMLDKGYGITEIAGAVGCSEETVRKYRKKREDLLKSPQALAEVKANIEGVRRGLELRAIEAINRGVITNPLDIARDSWDLAEIGTGTGIVIAGAVDDIRLAFDRNLPYTKRVARGMRGAQAVVSIFAGIYEGISQFTEKREGGVVNAVINRQKGEEKGEK